MNYRTVSLMHLLTVSSLGAAVAIVHGDREGHPRGRLRRRRRRASSRLVRRLLRREIATSYRNQDTDGASVPTEARSVLGFKANRSWRAVSARAEAARHGRSACSCRWPFSLSSERVCSYFRYVII